MDNRYHIVTHWRVPGSVQEVEEILGEPEDLPSWWPSVYLGSEIIKQGGVNGVGRVVDLYTKGFLPYTLRWRFRVADVVPGEMMRLEAWGDFIGDGVWTFVPDGDYTNVFYDWNITAEKPLLRSLTILLRPIFTLNHLWAMKMGERSLRLELERRRAHSESERMLIPAPPGPTTSSPVPWLLGLAAIVAFWALMLRRRR